MILHRSLIRKLQNPCIYRYIGQQATSLHQGVKLPALPVMRQHFAFRERAGQLLTAFLSMQLYDLNEEFHSLDHIIQPNRLPHSVHVFHACA